MIGPTGVALAGNGTLYFADTLDNRISAISHAMTRAGSLFGLATVPGKAGIYFVDDGDNTLKLLH